MRAYILHLICIFAYIFGQFWAHIFQALIIIYFLSKCLKFSVIGFIKLMSLKCISLRRYYAALKVFTVLPPTWSIRIKHKNTVTFRNIPGDFIPGLDRVGTANKNAIITIEQTVFPADKACTHCGNCLYYVHFNHWPIIMVLPSCTLYHDLC